MTLADAGYLDLRNPLENDVLCLKEWPLRHQVETWTDRKRWLGWFSYRKDTKAWLESHTCEAPSLTDKSCARTSVPLLDMQRSLGSAFGVDFVSKHDVLEAYAHLFLYLTVWLWVAILVHDLTLLSVRNRNFVLDWQGMNTTFPCIRQMLRMTAVGAWNRCRRGGSARNVVALALTPFLACWVILVFCFAMLPLGMVFFAFYPLRLSRALVFILSMAAGILGSIMTMHSIVFLADVTLRPAYAVTWVVDALAGGDETPADFSEVSCICGCMFPIRAEGCLQVMVTGSLVVFKAFLLAFRCLKGLRRSNWANLMSVTFAVPLTIYDVEWQYHGQPIKHRKEGEPVQGELAFDPFAMLDEQLNSASTTVNIFPVSRRKAVSRTMQGPLTPSPPEDQLHEYIGCCGFPCRKPKTEDDQDPGWSSSDDEDRKNSPKKDRKSTHCAPKCGSRSKQIHLEAEEVSHIGFDCTEDFKVLGTTRSTSTSTLDLAKVEPSPTADLADPSTTVADDSALDASGITMMLDGEEDTAKLPAARSQGASSWLPCLPREMPFHHTWPL